MWANWYMNQWDMYIESSQNVEKAVFKKTDEKSYAMYRDAMQILDIAVLNCETLQYNSRVLIASILYLVLSLHYNVMSLDVIVKRVPYFSDYLEPNDFNVLYSAFLEGIFSFELVELLPAIQYLSEYFMLPFVYDLPETNQKHQNVDGYEEFLSYQMHHGSQLEFVKKIKQM